MSASRSAPSPTGIEKALRAELQSYVERVHLLGIEGGLTSAIHGSDSVVATVFASGAEKVVQGVVEVDLHKSDVTVESYLEDLNSRAISADLKLRVRTAGLQDALRRSAESAGEVLLEAAESLVRLESAEQAASAATPLEVTSSGYEPVRQRGFNRALHLGYGQWAPALVGRSQRTGGSGTQSVAQGPLHAWQ